MWTYFLKSFPDAKPEGHLKEANKRQMFLHSKQSSTTNHNSNIKHYTFQKLGTFWLPCNLITERQNQTFIKQACDVSEE
jgi:hypothetical protein